MAIALQKLTWDDIKDVPESHERTELVDGELIVSPISSRQHQWTCCEIGVVIREFVQRKELGAFYMHPIHIILSKHTHYEPDLCFIARERDKDPDGAPDLVIEVISEIEPLPRHGGEVSRL